MSEDEEKQAGAADHPKILKAYGGEYGSPALKFYVNNIGKALAAVSEVPELLYTFTILNDEKVNAFALPGGYVYITRGLLALAENEAEIAGVLAHEIGHITARHGAERRSTAMATQIGLTVLGVIGSAVGVPTGVGQAVSYGAQAAVQGFSREQELEADMLGVRYMTRLGYSPDGLTTFFNKMSTHSILEAKTRGKAGVQHNIMSTHPRTEDRITQAIKLAKTKKIANPIIGRDAYLARIDGLIFGDDPEQGIRNGRTFTHPKLRIQFKVPPGFAMVNSKDKLEAFGPDNSKIIFDMANPESVRQSGGLKNYLVSQWGKNIELKDVEDIDINGMESATGVGVLQTSAGPRVIRLIAIKSDAKSVYRMLFVTLPDKTAKFSTDLQRTTYSFRRLSPSEANSIRPLTIKTVRVRPGDTVASLSQRMPIETYGREWFQLINSLKPNDQLKVGQTVKIISG